MTVPAVARRAAPAFGLIGGAMGFWLFGWRGFLLFASAGVGFVLLQRLAASRAPAATVCIPLVLAAVLHWESATLTWGGADAPDGTRYKVSPVQLSRILAPGQTVSPTEDCGWYGRAGAPPCALTPDRPARLGLLAIYPLLLLGMAGCGAGALACGCRAWRRRAGAIVQATALLPVASLILLATTAERALAALAGLDVGVGGTLGVMEVTAATLLALTAGSDLRRAAPPS
jgi:hypothetical protein